MAISDKIESIENHLKDDYQSIANLGADLTNIDKNIENIAECVNQIYEDYPKTEFQEGTSITLSNCKKGKLDFEDDIVGIGDTSQKSYEGYNVYNSTLKSQTTKGITVTKKEDGTYILNGTCTANNLLDFHFGTNQIDETKNYRITAINSVPNGLNIFAVVTKSDETTQYPLLNTATGTTINNSKSVLIFARINPGITLNNIIIKPMVSSDTSKTYDDFEPYVGGTASPNPTYPQEIEVVRGTQTVYIKDENNNIIDTKTINLGEYEFAKIGNYVDTIEYDVDEDKVYKNKVIGKKNNIVGNDFVFYQSNVGNQVYQYRTVSHYFSDVNLTPDPFHIEDIAYSNYFLKKDDVNALNNYYFTISGTGTLVINVPFSTLQELKEWVDSVNLEFYYQLEQIIQEEITTTLKDQIKALYYSHSFTGTTIIEIDGNLPLIIKVRALKGE